MSKKRVRKKATRHVADKSGRPKSKIPKTPTVRECLNAIWNDMVRMFREERGAQDKSNAEVIACVKLGIGKRDEILGLLAENLNNQQDHRRSIELLAAEMTDRCRYDEQIRSWIAQAITLLETADSELTDRQIERMRQVALVGRSLSAHGRDSRAQRLVKNIHDRYIAGDHIAPTSFDGGARDILSPLFEPFPAPPDACGSSSGATDR